MKLLEGKTALITGANRGIGKAIAVMFASHGADIAFSDLFYNDDSIALENELSGLGVKAKGYASDASSFDSSQKLVSDLIKDFGKLEILVNNAGITRDNLLLRITEQDWDLVINIHLKSMFNLTKAVMSDMIKQRFGVIININ